MTTRATALVLLMLVIGCSQQRETLREHGIEMKGAGVRKVFRF